MSPRRPAREEGAVLPLVALMLVVLLGMAALSIDVGNAYLHKRRLQSAVDLAALAGAQRLPAQGTAQADAQSFAQQNWTGHDTTAMSATTSVSCQVAGCPSPDALTVDATTDVPTSFAKIFGLDHITVHVKATACGPCDASPRKFDVMIVLDRSYSMCLDSAGRANGCFDLQQAIAGIKTLIPFFDPATDRIGLATLSSGDSVAPFAHSGSSAPCDSADIADAQTNTFSKSVGDFMDGTPASHDSWVLAPLAGGFKNADGSVNASSPLGTVLNCVQPKYWTPLAPAIQAATQELVTRGRTDKDVDRVIVVFSDGGPNVQPMQRTAAGAATTTRSWYTPSPGNDLMPCHDAVGQGAIAKAAGISIYTIGYDLNASTANTCYRANHPSSSAYVEPGIDARSTLSQLASTSDGFYEKANPGEVLSIFSAIGHQITSGGVRLIR
jgi:Flp pilus assembly protein TadG